MLPAALALGLALGYPLVRQVVLSFQEFGLAQQFGGRPSGSGSTTTGRWSPTATCGRSCSASLAFCLVNAALTMALGIGIALLMRLMSGPVRLLVQTGLLLAWAMPVLASLTVWQWLFDTQYGVVNWTLTRLGLRLRGPLVAARTRCRSSSSRR